MNALKHLDSLDDAGSSDGDKIVMVEEDTDEPLAGALSESFDRALTGLRP